MKSGRILTAILVLSIGLVIAVIARNTYWDETSVPMPMKGEARTNSMYAAQRFAEALGATAHVQHQLDLPREANGIIYLSYWNWNLAPKRRERLHRWVEAGGRLIADRSLIGGDQELERWSGIKRSLLKVSKDDESSDDISGADNLERCMDLETETATPDPNTSRVSYYVCRVDHGTRLTSSRRPTWLLSDSEGIQAVRVGIGAGSFTLINAQPFDNRALFDGDDALLFVSATGIDRGDRIHFLSEEKGGSLLELIWRHGAPVVVLSLGVIALALWRGSLRFGPPAAVTDPARRSLAEQIIGTGRFTLRFGGGRALHTASVRALHETAQQHISGYGRLQKDMRIVALAQNTGMDPPTLAAAINFVGSHNSSELHKVVTLLETARRRLS
jgi:hypothetical protein